MIRLMNLSKKYGKKQAIKNVSVDFPSSGIVGVVGENGCGKTTLFRILAGLRKQDKGHIYYQGKEVQRVFDVVAINPELNEVYNETILKLAQLNSRFYSDFKFEQFSKMMQETNIQLEHLYEHLSKGQKTLVNLALTLSRDVPIYLLDEPFSGLDIIVRKRIIDYLIKYLNVDQKLVLISSHDLSHLERLVDSVLLIKDGELMTHQIISDLNGDLRGWTKNVLKQEVQYD